MKNYFFTEYINDIFACIADMFPMDKNPEVAFGEGNLPLISSGNDRDYAILRNENAVLFVNTVREHSELFGIDKERVSLQRSKLCKSEVRYRHSCYPKNLHRWRSGTLARKKFCRIEFVTMVYCWAVSWNNSKDRAENSPVAERLSAICRRYCNDICEGEELLVCLWKACESAYRYTGK